VVSSDALDTVVVQGDGHLIFRTDVSTRLTATTVIVLENGELQVGTASNPVQANVKAEIVFADSAIDTAVDPLQLGHGLLGMGKVTMFGAVKNDTFIRLATEPKAGDKTLSLQSPATGWQVGDKLILPDSRQQSNLFQGNDWELASIASISADGLTITLSAAL